ncbi:hypothetical protein Ciccas_004978 [Cichlidogyrus casuarinus]|uniref:Uncharacterized protein n=1 Tax=Cichlidogyrus casuarinus TaxID=1844966 RepID=A0ABD2Q9Z1_9PLAT
MSSFSASSTYLPLIVRPLLFYEKLLPLSDQQKYQPTLLEKCLRLTIFALSSFHGLCNFNDQLKKTIKTWFSSWVCHSSASQDQFLDFIFALFPHLPYFGFNCQENLLEMTEKQLLTRLRGSELRNSRETSIKTPKWNVAGLFLPGEGLRLLPLDTEPAVENIRLSFLIATLVDCDLFEALFTCLTKGHFLIKRKSAFLLGFLFHDVLRLFPKNHALTQRMERLQTEILDLGKSEARLVTNLLLRVDSLSQKMPPSICKIFENPNLCPLDRKNSIFNLASPFFGILSLGRQACTKEEIAIPAWIIESVTSDSVFNWDLLALIAHSWIIDPGKSPLDAQYLTRVAAFCFDLEQVRKAPKAKSCPRSEESKSEIHDTKALPWLDSTWTEANKAGWVVYGLVRHLTYYPKESIEAVLLDQMVERLHKLIASSEKFMQSLRTSCSPLLILAIGALTASSEGEARMPRNLKNLLLQKMLQFPLQMEDFLFIKVLIASCDYRRPDGIGRQLLTAAVSCSLANCAVTHQVLAIYCLQMIQLLFRLQVQFISNWAVEPVLQLLAHPSHRVACRAVSVLYVSVCFKSWHQSEYLEI